MTKKLEKDRTKRMGFVCLTMAASVCVLLCLGALLCLKLIWNEAQLEICAAGILFLMTFLSGAVLFFRVPLKKPALSFLLFWLCASAVWLMLGFLIYGDRLDGRGLLRVLLGTLAGALACLPIHGRKKRARGKVQIK